MVIKTKKELQKSIMTNPPVWWNVNHLTDVLREQLPKHPEIESKSINHSTVERYIRDFRKPKHCLFVEKKKVADNTFLYRASRRGK